MAYEIQQGAHLQLSPLNLSFDTEANFKNTSTKGGVQFNFQHDLESVWWLLLWIVTRGVEHSDSHQFARRVFSNQTRPSQNRTQMFMHPIQLSDALTKQLHSSVRNMAMPFSHSRNTPPLRVKRKHSDILYSMENQTKRRHGLDS